MHISNILKMKEGLKNLLRYTNLYASLKQHKLNKFRKKWRKNNSHNLTTVNNCFSPELKNSRGKVFPSSVLTVNSLDSFTINFLC